MLKKLLCNILLRTNKTLSYSNWKRFLSITLENEKKFLIIHDEHSKEPLKFPAIWLRDNCYCPQCFHMLAKCRTYDLIKQMEFDINVCIKDVQVKSENEQIIVNWNDGHQSVYDLNWLKQRAFITERQKHYLNNFYRPKSKHWSAKDFEKICKRFIFKHILHENEALKSWLECLAVYGVALIQSAPDDKSALRQLANRVGFIRKTTYGEEFIVQVKADAKNPAYLSDPLPLHTDLPYYEYKPGCNMLHCLEQTQSNGGQNLLVDAFHIADRLRLEHPNDFKILTNTMVDWNDIGSEDQESFHNIWRSPVINVDNEGNYTRVNHSISQRDSHFTVPIEDVLPWYQAYAKFLQLAYNDAHIFKLQPGYILTFNNMRILHGRTGYDDTESNVRYIVGAYIDWDIIYSKLRVLKTVL